jgi:hypothetical protein
MPTATLTSTPAPTRTPTPTATATPVLERKVATNTLGYTSFNTATLSIDSAPLAAGTNVKPTVTGDGRYTTYEGMVQATWTNDKKEQVTGFVDAKAIGITEGELKSAKTLTHADNPLGFAPEPPGGASPEVMQQYFANPKKFKFFDGSKYKGSTPYQVYATGRYNDSFVDSDNVLNVGVNIEINPTMKPNVKYIKMPVAEDNPFNINTNRPQKAVNMILTGDVNIANLALRYYFRDPLRVGIGAKVLKENSQQDPGLPPLPFFLVVGFIN